MTDPELLAGYERWFRDDPDPWRYETDVYEARKRRATIAACGTATGRLVLELGAANGVLAADLLPLARELIAVEAVPAAAALARQRLASPARVVEGLIPRDVPAGPYDLVIASEILYYLDADAFEATLEVLPQWVARHGRLVAVHWRPTGPERPRSAVDVHAALAQLPDFRRVIDASTADYLLTALERR